jgi:hypothetical protein
MAGQTIFTQFFDELNPSTEISIPTPISSGFYFISVNNADPQMIIVR